MNSKEISQTMKDVAAKYGATVRRDTENCDDNQGASAGKEIFLGNFNDLNIELLAFFHELGHTLSSTICKRGEVMTILSGEGLAWELGLGIAFEHGYEWDYYGHEMSWARKQFSTYTHE